MTLKVIFWVDKKKLEGLIFMGGSGFALQWRARLVRQIHFFFCYKKIDAAQWNFDFMSAQWSK